MMKGISPVIIVHPQDPEYIIATQLLNWSRLDHLYQCGDITQRLPGRCPSSCVQTPNGSPTPIPAGIPCGSLSDSLWRIALLLPSNTPPASALLNIPASHVLS